MEARVRVGGRCQTGTYKGESFDVGGHWIGAHQPRVRKLIESQGLKFKAQYDEGKHVLRLFKQYVFSLFFKKYSIIFLFIYLFNFFFFFFFFFLMKN